MGRKKMELNLQNVIIDLHFNVGLSYNYLTRLFALNIKACKSTIYNICQEYKQNKLSGIKTNLKPRITNDINTDTDININNNINTDANTDTNADMNTDTNANIDTNIKANVNINDVKANANIDTQKNIKKNETKKEKIINDNSYIEELKYIDINDMSIRQKDYICKKLEENNKTWKNSKPEEIIKLFKYFYPEEYKKYNSNASILYGRKLFNIDLNRLTSDQKMQILQYIYVEYKDYNSLPIEQIPKVLIIDLFKDLYPKDYEKLTSHFNEDNNLKNIDVKLLSSTYQFEILNYLKKQNSIYSEYRFDDLPINIIIKVFKAIFPNKYDIYDNEQYESNKYPHVDFCKLTLPQQKLIELRARFQELYSIKDIIPQEEINRLYFEMQEERKKAKEQEEELKQQKLKEDNIKKKIPVWYNEDYYVQGIHINYMKTYLAFLYLYKNKKLPSESILEQIAKNLLEDVSNHKYIKNLNNQDIIRVFKMALNNDTKNPENITEWFWPSYEWITI